ncbi:MAG: MFS transporter [Gammaproteobacteria bacterium]
MWKQLSGIFALTATNGLLQAGHGALSSLLVQQGGRLEFSETLLGAMISCTYLGFLASGLLLSRLLPRISFIRTFAVCASLMASFALLMPMLPFTAAWLVLRFFHGMFLCAAVIICDGWLNTNATKENRGKLMGVFMTVNYLSYGAGQYVLIIGESVPAHAFMAAALLLALCLLPMCLTRFPEPQPPAREDSDGMRWRDAYAIAPVAFWGQFGFGAFTGATLLFISYVEGLGVTTAQQSSLAALFFGCGFMLQIPAGWLADKVRDRRDLLMGISAFSAVGAGALGLGNVLPYGVLVACIILLGAVSSNLFGLNMAYGQDFVERGKSAVYSGVLLRVYAAGALTGPPVAGFLMGAVSPNMLFVFCAAVMGGMTLVTATNRIMPRYRPAKTEQFRPVSPLTATSATVAEVLYTETDIGPDFPEDDSAEPSEDAENDSAAGDSGNAAAHLANGAARGKIADEDGVQKNAEPAKE